MNRDDIIRIAESFGIPEFDNNESQADNILDFFYAAYAAGAAAEREECAKMCDDRASSGEHFIEVYAEAKGCADAIRARGEK